MGSTRFDTRMMDGPARGCRRRGAAWLALPVALGASLAAPLASPAQAQDVPADLATMPPVPDDFRPARTAWGDPDLRGTWPLNDIAELPVERPARFGDRFWKTEAEIEAEQARARQIDEAYATEEEGGTIGIGHWIEYRAGDRRTSMVVSPASGRLPAWTPEGIRRSALMRSSWVIGQTYDWVDDFDTWDRCVTRGFPASMFPFRYNNGVRIFQSPGHVTIALEMLGTRVIPVAGQHQPWPDAVEGWFGHSRGRWLDHNTLEIETTNIKPGASALNLATRGVPPNNTTPMSDQARVIERLSMIGPDTITYEMHYEDPVIWTEPFTLRVNWTRDDAYEFFEYACHEGNVQVRNYITSDRALRAQEFARGRMFDPVDPNAGPPPAMDPASRGLGNRPARQTN